MTILISLGAFLLLVAILITAHEFGHFIVARSLGVRVLRFSVGFGKPLLRFKGKSRSATEYVISALPFGGYVKMLDEREGPVPEEDLAGAFNRQKLWRRSLIVAAGPAFNLLFAVLAYWVAFVVGIPGIKPVLGPVAPNSPAARAGLHERDQILSVNDRSTPTWQAAQMAMLDSVVSNQPLRLRVRPMKPAGAAATTHEIRYQKHGNLTKPGKLLPDLGVTVWAPPIKPVLAVIQPKSPASRAGLKVGDQIISVDGQPVRSWQALAKRIRANPGQRMHFVVQRAGTRSSVTLTVGKQQAGGRTVGHIGAGVKVPSDYMAPLRATQRYSPWSALSQAADHTGTVTALTVVMMYRMATGQGSVRDLSGPVSIAKYAGSWAEAGTAPFIYFLALISIELGVLNLLPIPLLDGGQLLYHLIEWVRRRPLSERAEAFGVQIGLGLLAVLVGLALFSDLSRIFH